MSNGISYTARSLKTDSAADLTGSSENWTQELSWSDAGLAMDLRTDGEESWVGWYARSTGTQWALGAEDSAQSVLHSACGILKTLGYDVAVAPEDAENVTYSVLEIDGQTVAETAFTLDGIPYRWHVGTGDSEDPERLVDLSAQSASIRHGGDDHPLVPGRAFRTIPAMRAASSSGSISRRDLPYSLRRTAW